MIDESNAEKSVSRSLRWSWTLVVACGLILGYFFLQTYLTPRQRQYHLDFGKAQWIESPEDGPIAYFRKEVFLSHTPSQAWLEVAATDNFQAFVNGRAVGSEDSLKTRVAGISDIKKTLKVGTNVIAISISRISFPGGPQLLVSGLITEPGGEVTKLLSDESWRVTTKTGIVQGSEEWTSPQVQQELWPAARRAGVDPGSVSIGWTDTNPLLYQLPIVGSWILLENGASEAVFSTSFEADESRQETWIQLASSGEFDLLVNGNLVKAADTSASSGRRLPHFPNAQPSPQSSAASRDSRQQDRPKLGASKQERSRPKASSSRTAQSGNLTVPLEKATLAAFDISYYVKRGPNHVVVAVRNEQGPARLFADGFLRRDDGSVRRFMTDSHWRAGDRPSAAQPASGYRVIEIGKYGAAPWGYLPQEVARPLDHSSFKTFARSISVLLATTALVVALWLIVSAIVANLRGERLPPSMSRDALFHGPVAVGLVLLLLPNYDPRFPVGWSFHPLFVVGAFSALLAIRLLHLFVYKGPGLRLNFSLPNLRQTELRAWLPYLLLALIMGLGLALRAQNLGYMSFDHDEMGLVVKSRGVLKLGFPHVMYAGEVRPVTTYEAVPYPMALSGFLFGYSEWSMRLPACIMATLSIGILALFGRRLFDWRTGLLTALIYACLPLNIRWGQNAFYLSQCQFMALLTMWMFYEAMSVRPIRLRYLTAASIFFCLTYLSWEGTGFLLPALFVALIVVRWGEWWWLKEFHLYRCLFFVGAVVLAQYCSRAITGSPYLQIGSGLSNLSGPSLFFLTPAYQPTFYISRLWLAENHVFFTLATLLSIPFCWSQRGYRYALTLLVTLFVLHTNFIAALSPRYCYYFQPLLLLTGIGGAMMLYDRLILLAKGEGDSMVARVSAHATGLAVMVLLFLQSNEWIMKEYKLAIKGDTPGLMTRLNTYRYDYRGAAQFVMSHIQPGDLILPGIPHTFEYYAGRPGDYFLDTLFAYKVPYNQLLAEPRFVDKFGGLPAIRNLTELKEVTHRARRTWIVLAPYSSFHKTSARNVNEYLDNNAKIEFESYRAKVLLIQGARPLTAVAGAP